MRQISPRPEPVKFMEWRAGSQNDINYDSARFAQYVHHATIGTSLL
jgi:hypothetical protein